MMSLRERGKPAVFPPGTAPSPPLSSSPEPGSLPPHRPFNLALTPSHCPPEHCIFILILPVSSPLPSPSGLWSPTCLLILSLSSPTDTLPLHCPFLLGAGSSHIASLLGTAPSSWAPPLPLTCPFILVLPPPAHCLFPEHSPTLSLKATQPIHPVLAPPSALSFSRQR